MSCFPDPIMLPDSVFQSRAKRNRELLRAAKWGIAIRFSIILFEVFGFLLFGSAALMMDALSSLVDIAATLFLVFFIRLAEKPPDRNHPFGHGRYEPLAGLQLGMSMILIGGGMLIREITQLAQPSPLENTMSRWAWLIPFLAVILLEICYRLVIRIAAKENSPALAADAAHYRMDGMTSFIATIALIIAAYFPDWAWSIDKLGAIMIAGFMVVIGVFAARDNMHQLLDRVPSSDFFKRVRLSALKVNGVRETEKIRIQLYGPDAQVRIDIEVDPQLSVEDAHKISQEVRAEIQRDWPAVRDVIVHIEPFYPNDHASTL
ncbi:cation diffusion facilitator family transporter [Parachlamydia sp. AcF125]|uniref:cation diffusion facilitator family transporter n=1 Tax=Parachlamydia sp. AcF125 TaxID=2795736 RepID=UPI001BC997DC|nr:cation diffusion facilitator family transporter [Parachlamydia sp. AcF125]MBS4169290.1 Ferrous-iron efflux pump FieF [Parachlamydia sp. AcF125]